MSEGEKESLYEKLVRCSFAADVPQRLRFYEKPKLWESMGVVFREGYSGTNGKDVLLKVQPVLLDVYSDQSVRGVEEYQLIPERVVCDGQLYEVSNKRECFRIENAFREVKVLDYLARTGLGERYVQRLFCGEIGIDHELFFAGGDLYLRTLMEQKPGHCLGDMSARFANENEKNFGIMDPKDIVRCAADLAEDLLVLRTHSIYHNDVKRANVLRELGDVQGESQFHLIDFGSARFYHELADRYLAVGTAGYQAPEILKAYGPNSYSDAWSLGVLLYVEITGQLPFSGNYKVISEDDLFARRRQLYRAAIPFQYEFLDAIVMLLSDDARKRDLAQLQGVSTRLLQYGSIYRDESESPTLRLQKLERSNVDRERLTNQFKSTAATPLAEMRIAAKQKAVTDTFTGQEGEIDVAALQAALGIPSE